MKQKKAGPRRQAPDRAKAAAQNAQRRHRRRTGRQTLNYILILLSAAAVMLILSLTVFFRIEKIEVVGTSKYAPQQILETAGIKTGDNLFRVSEKQVTKKLIERFTYVEAVQLKRTFPPKLTVEITQAKPLGAVMTDGGYVIIGSSGKILESGAETPPDGVMVITGMYLSDQTVGRSLGQIDPKGAIVAPDEQFASSSQESSSEKPVYAAAESSSAPALSPKKLDQQRREQAAEVESDCMNMLRLLSDAIEQTNFERITLVDFTDRLNMLIVYEDRVMIELGSQANLPYKLNFAQWTIEEGLEPTFQGILDVSIDKETWVDPGNITQELEKRRMQAINAATSSQEAPDEAQSPERETIKGSASSSSSSESSSSASESSASESSSSRNPREVIPNSDKPETGSSSSETSAQPQPGDGGAVSG